MEKIKTLWRFFTSREVILYFVFGVLTTVINIAVFNACYSGLGWPWQTSNVLAWVLAVIFAFLTNKFFVFESKSFEAGVFWRECAEFFAARLFSLGVDMLCMWIFIDILLWNGLAAKIVDNVLVIVINYALSKLIIFKKK